MIIPYRHIYYSVYTIYVVPSSASNCDMFTHSLIALHSHAMLTRRFLLRCVLFNVLRFPGKSSYARRRRLRGIIIIIKKGTTSALTENKVEFTLRLFDGQQQQWPVDNNKTSKTLRFFAVLEFKLINLLAITALGSCGLQELCSAHGYDDLIKHIPICWLTAVIIMNTPRNAWMLNPYLRCACARCMVILK